MPHKDPERRAAYSAAYRAAHKAEKAAYNAAYRAAHQGEKAAYMEAYNAAYRAAHKAERAAYDAAYHAEHKEAHRLNSARHREKHPEQVAARRAVQKEVKAGRWPSADGQVCELCGEAQAQEYHHHLGYAPEHWLHAQAVCKECHIEEHRKYSITGETHNGNRD